MSLRNVAGLYLVRLRGRIGQELLAFVGIAAGVSLLFAALVANSSLTASFDRLTDAIVGDAQYQLVARGSGTLSEGLLVQAQSLPGVEKAAGIFDARVEVTGPDGSRSVLLLGVTPELGELRGAFSKGFSYDFLEDVRAVAMPTPLADSLGLALAQPVRFAIGSRVVDARLGAKLQTSDIRGANESPVALAPLRYAQELADRPAQITRLVVLVEEGREADVAAGLREIAKGTAELRAADFEADLLRQAAQPTSQSTAMFSVLGAMVGFLFAFSAMLLTVPQRRRLIADLDTEGYGPGTVAKVMLFDALVLGVTASAVGIALGDQVARRLFADVPSFLQYAFPIGSDRIVGVDDVLVAAAGGILASCVAVLGPTARSMAGRPERAPLASDARLSRAARWSTLAGAASLVTGLIVVVAAPPSAPVGIAGIAALTVAMLLLLPTALRLAVRAVEAGTARMVSVVPFIATFDLRDPTTQARSLAVAATGAVAVFGSIALQGAHGDLLRGLDRTTDDVVAMGEVWALAPGDANLLVTTSFPAPRARAGDGLARVASYRGGFLDIEGRRVSVFGPPADGPLPLSETQLLDGDLDTAVARLRAGGWMVMSERLARDHGLSPGDRFTLPSPRPITLRIAALSTNMGWPPGALIVNADDVRRAWGSDDVSAVLADLEPGTSPAEGKRALAERLGPDTDLAIVTAAERQQQQKASSRSALARLEQIALMVLVSAVIAMASAMGGMIWQRRAFIAGVKVEGYGTADMWKALMLEAGILIGVGCALGAVFGLLGQSLLSSALTSVTGFPVVYSTAGVDAILTCAAVTVVAVAIVGLFGRHAADVPAESGVGA